MGAEAPAAPLAAGERRVFWLDAVRALAVISVTFNHALNRSVLDQISLLRQLNPYAFLGCLLYIFSRLGVPLFLMLSGALLLGRDYTQPRIRSRFYRHNWLLLDGLHHGHREFLLRMVFHPAEIAGVHKSEIFLLCPEGIKLPPVLDLCHQHIGLLAGDIPQRDRKSVV